MGNTRVDRIERTAPTLVRRTLRAGVRLNDGRVLVTGGKASGRADSSAEIYTPDR